MTAAVRNSADHAQAATQVALQASSAAVQGGEMAQRVVQTMGAIQGASRKIGKIIGTIDGSAFQTNILARNAAVEAARAGDAGRGFAVVASQVRGLAQRSAAAAREIKTLIGASVEKVEAGHLPVQQTGTAVDHIVEQVRRVTGLIGEISTSMGEQTHGIGAINGAITQLDMTTQQNAALVEQSAAAAQSLAEQARGLSDAVAVFRLERSAQPACGAHLPADTRVHERPPA